MHFQIMEGAINTGGQRGTAERFDFTAEGWFALKRTSPQRATEKRKQT